MTARALTNDIVDVCATLRFYKGYLFAADVQSKLDYETIAIISIPIGISDLVRKDNEGPSAATFEVKCAALHCAQYSI